MVPQPLPLEHDAAPVDDDVAVELRRFDALGAAERAVDLPRETKLRTVTRMRNAGLIETAWLGSSFRVRFTDIGARLARAAVARYAVANA